jgi:hypothetical protein
MSQVTECGLSHTHLVSIPNVGDFRLGFDDYELDRASGEGTLKIRSNRVLSSIEPGHWTFDITLFNVPKATYLAIRAQAYSSLNNFLDTGIGDVTVTFSGQTNKCYFIRVLPSKSYFDYDSNEYLEQLSLTLVNSTNNFF